MVWVTLQGLQFWRPDILNRTNKMKIAFYIRAIHSELSDRMHTSEIKLKINQSDNAI